MDKAHLTLHVVIHSCGERPGAKPVPHWMTMGHLAARPVHCGPTGVHGLIHTLPSPAGLRAPTRNGAQNAK